MDKELLKHDIVIEIGKDGVDTVYSSRTAQTAVEGLSETGAKLSENKIYCHKCFKFKCDTLEQLQEHEKTCNPSAKPSEDCGCN